MFEIIISAIDPSYQEILYFCSTNTHVMTKLQIVKESIESYWDDETIKQAWNDCCDSLGTPGTKYSLDKLAKFIIKEGADNDTNPES